MALPSWLVPTGLAALVGGFLWSKRQPEIQADDTVTVPIGKIKTGLERWPGAPTNAEGVFQISRAEGDELSGNATGVVDPATKQIVTVGVPIGIGPFGFAKGDVTAVYREGKKIA